MVSERSFDPREIERPFSQSIILNGLGELVLIDNSFAISIILERGRGIRAKALIFANGRIIINRSSSLEKTGHSLEQRTSGVKCFVNGFRPNRSKEDSLYIGEEYLIVADVVKLRGISFTVHSTKPVQIQHLGVVENPTALFKEKGRRKV